MEDDYEDYDDRTRRLRQENATKNRVTIFRYSQHRFLFQWLAVFNLEELKSKYLP